MAMSTLERAIAIAVEAHSGQIDKAGAAYILHPLRVMLRMTTNDERIVAVLHDVVEDSAWDLARLRGEGFSEQIVRAIESVTRRADESYEEFVVRAGSDPVGRRVKVADLEDNADITRLATPTDADRARTEKYRRALEQLRGPGAVYLLAVPGFADWEPAHALAELRRSGGYRVEVVGLDASVVESMGGLTVRPTRTLAELDPADVAIFILPGGDYWEHEPMPPDLTATLTRLDEQRVPIAAICAATTAIARAGLLRGRRHTSNGLSYLQERIPEYAAEGDYVDAPSVRDDHLITASGLGDVEFACDIMAELGVLSEEDRAMWVRLFRSGRLDGGAG
jgi:putative intracellular protease/amidase